MPEFLTKLFDTSDYPARWTCGNWGAFEGWLHIASDVLIFLACFAIPASLFLLVRRRRDVPFPAIFWLFIAFILSCGLTHLVEASIFWWPVYRFSGLMKATTAVVSLITMVALVRALPRALALPALVAAHGRLSKEIHEERSERTRVELHRADLERRSSELAVRERRLRDAVGNAKAFGVVWEVGTGKIEWVLGFPQAMRSAGLGSPAGTLAHWSQLLGDEQAETLVAASVAAWERGEVLHRRFELEGHTGEWDVRMTATPDPEVAGQPRTMSGLAGLVPTKDSIGLG